MSENSIHTGLACVLPLHLIIAALFGWLEREQHDLIESCGKRTAY
jgi:hypothetical protein